MAQHRRRRHLDWPWQQAALCHVCPHGRAQRARRVRAGGRAPPQPLVFQRAAGPLSPRARAGSPGQAGGLRERWVPKRRLVLLCCATAAYAAAAGRPSSSARHRARSSRTAWAAAHRSQSATAARATARACWPKACTSATAPPPPRLLICMRPASSSSSSSARSCAWCAQGDARCNPGGLRLQPDVREAATLCS